VFGWRHGLHARPADAKGFYLLIAAFTAAGVAMNFFGINPMKALVVAGIVQGFSTPPLMAMIVRLTSDRRVMGSAVNGTPLTVLGWATVALIFAATGGLVVSWFA
jgi:Mn2+/Fe2+ NRAMP family transporter